MSPGRPGGAERHSGGRCNPEVNHKPAISVIETMDQVAEIRPGSRIPVEILTQRQKLTVEITIQEYPVLK
ncbi:hypothetical protein BG74_02050 [Sodalis-like endosymbiont of Proechinophthirus fluctus]|nr:hypothetical protein BG74_02050 [Sodalis-like endosymbiont of Proechinophthirus fluctus]